MRDGAEPDDVALIAELLSLPGGERFPPLDLSPQRKKERTFAALLRQLEGLARRQPVLMIFEDLHWIDPTSRELLDLRSSRSTRLPVLLVATFRPEFQPPWVGQPHVTVLTLNRLGRDDGAAMVHRLAGNAGHCRRSRRRDRRAHRRGAAVCRGTDQGGARSWRRRGCGSISAVPSPSLAVPATLHASLMARLDRLGPAAKDSGAGRRRDRSRVFL